MVEDQLTQRREWIGQWFLPSEPETREAGILTYDPSSGLRLQLIGGWPYLVTRPVEDGGIAVTGEFREWPVVLGEANGKYITLLDATVVSAKSHSLDLMMGDAEVLGLRATAALIGCHLTDPEEPAFVGADCTIENLTAWCSRSGLARQFEADPEGRPRGQSIILSPVSAISVEVGKLTASLCLTWDSRVSTARLGTTASIAEHAGVAFSSVEPQNLDYWLGLIAAMADLTSMSVLRACGVLSMTVFLPPTPDDYPVDHPLKNQRHKIEVFQRRLVEAQADEPAEHPRQMVLTLTDLPFEDVLPAWLELRDKFVAPVGMILSLQTEPHGYLETRVVTAVAAAESLHRTLEYDPPIPPAEYSAIKRMLMEHVPAKQRSWLSDQLASNEPTLKKRLLDLWTRLGATGEALISDPQPWAKAAKDARNTIAHVGSRTGQDVQRLYAVVEVTAAVVILNLLQELGVPEERLIRTIGENDRLSHARDLARDSFSTSKPSLA